MADNLKYINELEEEARTLTMNNAKDFVAEKLIKMSYEETMYLQRVVENINQCMAFDKHIQFLARGKNV